MKLYCKYCYETHSEWLPQGEHLVLCEKCGHRSKLVEKADDAPSGNAPALRSSCGTSSREDHEEA